MATQLPTGFGKLADAPKSQGWAQRSTQSSATAFPGHMPVAFRLELMGGNRLELDQIALSEGVR